MMMRKMFIITCIEKKTKANMNTAPKIKSICIVSLNVFEISSPSMMQYKEKKAILGSWKR